MADSSALLIHGRNEFGWADIRAALNQLNISMAGEARTAEAAIAHARRVRPDLVLASSELDGESSLPVLAEMRRDHLAETPFVVFAHDLDQLELVGFANLNLSGFLTWRGTRSIETIACTIRLALTGEATVGSWSIARDYFLTKRRLEGNDRTAFELSSRELGYLAHRAQGRPHAEIARLERVSSSSVDRLSEKLRAKLDAPDLFTLGMKAALLGLIP